MQQQKMNPEWKARWIEALTSGKYTQGDSRLRKQDNTYCCLGVLCDLVAPDSWILNEAEGDFYIFGSACVLPTRIANAIGLSYPNIKVPVFNPNNDYPHPTPHYLSDLNDCYEYTFPEIAELIQIYL